MPAVLKRIAAIAKGLNKAELHVLIELAARAEVAGHHDAVGSSRELAEQTGLARASVQAAIDSLNSSGVIKSDSGAATRAAQHRLLFLAAVEIQEAGPTIRPRVAQESGHCGLDSEPVVAQKLGQGGRTARPELAQILSHGGLKTEPGVAQNFGQGGLDSGPLTNSKSNTCGRAHTENASARAESIEKKDLDTLIDRLQKAQKSDFNDEVFEQARNLIASHQAKFAREGSKLVGLPDDQITAQFLAIAEWPTLSSMLYDLVSERKQPSFSWAWYVTVALQRVHGISPERVREVRPRLKFYPPRLPSVISSRAQPDLDTSAGANRANRCQTAFGVDFRDGVRALAAMKTIR